MVWYINFEFNGFFCFKFRLDFLKEKSIVFVDAIRLVCKVKNYFGLWACFFKANLSASLTVSLKNFWYKSQDLLYFIYFFCDFVNWIFKKKKKKIILLFSYGFFFSMRTFEFFSRFSLVSSFFFVCLITGILCLAIYGLKQSCYDNEVLVRW